jgi:glycosyltransferase involved in cell wall biosynthesis
MRVAIITNMPAPYRVPSWNEAALVLGDDFLVIFCCRREPNRQWDVPPIHFNHVFLKENFREKGAGNYVHNNKDVWNHLNAFSPDVVITGGFNPTMLYAIAYTILKRKKHIPVSDAWEMAEKHLSPFHIGVRKFVYRFSHAFIACSIKGKEYFESFGLSKESVFVSHLAISDGKRLPKKSFGERTYDLMFSGQFIERKHPFFFVQVALAIKKIKKDLKLLVLGAGPLEGDMIRLLEDSGIEYDFPGFARQEDLPGYYSATRIFLFPTQYDAWGVVANEAMIMGTPVITTPNAGCADELVLHDITGFVLPLDEHAWVDKCLELLKDENRWNCFAEKAVEISSTINYKRSAEELIRACTFACRK